MLTTGHTSTTWVLSVLSDTTMTGTDMASTIVEVLSQPRLILKFCASCVCVSFQVPSRRAISFELAQPQKRGRILWTYCFLVFDKRVGIVTVYKATDAECKGMRCSRSSTQAWVLKVRRVTWRKVILGVIDSLRPHALDTHILQWFIAAAVFDIVH